MNNEKLLTIGIPAYNRPDKLEKIIQLLQNEKEDFTLLIADDSSNDSVEKMVQKYLSTMPNLIYKKNAKNLGYSGNICNLYESADTRYIWFFCDDDTLKPGAIKHVLTMLEKYSPTCATLSTEWVDSFGRLKIAGPKEDIVYNEISDLGEDYQPLMRMTFVSLNVVERRLPLDKIKETAYTDNVFVQLTIALMLLSDKFKYVEAAGTYIHRNVGYKYGDFFKFRFADELKAIHALEHAFDNKKFIAWSKRGFFSAFKLFMSRKLGLFSYTTSPTIETKEYLKTYFGYYVFILVLFAPIYAVTPRFLLRFLYKWRLISIHGYTKGIEVLHQNLDRASKDDRDTGFTEYK